MIRKHVFMKKDREKQKGPWEKIDFNGKKKKQGEDGEESNLNK